MVLGFLLLLISFLLDQLGGGVAELVHDGAGQSLHPLGQLELGRGGVGVEEVGEEGAEVLVALVLWDIVWCERGRQVGSRQVIDGKLTSSFPGRELWSHPTLNVTRYDIDYLLSPPLEVRKNHPTECPQNDIEGHVIRSG